MSRRSWSATYGVSFWLSLPLAGLFCAAASVLIGLPILRLRGVYFAMVTLVLTEVARLSALALPITNGAKGITNIPSPGPIRLFGLTIVPDFDTFAERNARLLFPVGRDDGALLRRRSGGSSIRASAGSSRSLRQNEELASSMGLNVPLLRVLAYAISSFLGGVGGAIFVAIAQSIYPSSFTVNDSVNFMLNCFLGGLGYVFGPMLGTLVLYFGWDLLFQTGEYQLLIYSGVMILLCSSCRTACSASVCRLRRRAIEAAARCAPDPRKVRRPHQALRRTDRGQRGLVRRRAERDPLGHRAQRRGQVDASSSSSPRS